MVQHDVVRGDPEQARQVALHADGHVAQPDRPVAVVEQRAGDDADRVREAHQPRVRRQLPRPPRHVQHDRHRAQRLREPACAGRLLADAAARLRERLVGDPRRLPAHPQLDDHHVRAAEPCVHIGRPRDTVVEQAAAERADHREPAGGGVDQRHRVHVEGAEARHELRGVGRPATDDRDLHPFTPVSVTPCTKAFCARKNTMITGAITTIVAAITRFHSTWCRCLNWDSASDSVQADCSSLV